MSQEGGWCISRKMTATVMQMQRELFAGCYVSGCTRPVIFVHANVFLFLFGKGHVRRKGVAAACCADHGSEVEELVEKSLEDADEIRHLGWVELQPEHVSEWLTASTERVDRLLLSTGGRGGNDFVTLHVTPRE